MKTMTWNAGDSIRWPAAVLAVAVGLSACATGGIQYQAQSETEPGSITLGPGGQPAPTFDRSTPPAVGRARSLDLPEMVEFTLQNGLTVVVVERDDLPLVSLSMQFPSGARVLRPEQAGLSALVADMMDEGTDTRTGFELAEAVDRLGADLRSFGGSDANGLQMNLLSTQFDDGLDLLAEVLLHPSFPQDALDRVKNERVTRVLQGRDDPRILANDAFARALYGEEHPYGQPLLGTEASLAAIDREDVLGYYQARYQPGGSILVVTGDVDAEALEPQLEELLSGWEAMANVTPAFEIPDPVRETTILIVDKPDAAQSEIRVGRVAIDYNEPDYLTLNVMNTVLGGSFTSRLNTRLREEKGYSYGARSGFTRRQLPGPFVASSAVYTPVTDSSVVEFVRELARMSDEEVSEDELEQARNYVALRLPSRFETVGDLGSRVAELYLYGLPKDFYDTFVDETLAVTAEEVQAAARQWLDLSRLVIVVAGDRATIEEPLRALGIGPVVVLEDPKPISQEDR